MSPADALQISPAGAGRTLTPAQKRFNTLLRQIERARETLTAWHENIATYRQMHAEVLQPMQTELLAGHWQRVLSLDALLDLPNWTKTERTMLRQLLCETAGELLEGGSGDEQIKALFDKHADVEFDVEQRDRMLAMKGLAEAITGLDLGDDEGFDTDQDLFARLEQGLQEQAAAEEAEEAARHAKASRRHKSTAQQRREAEAQQATQSMREIYRKLASALHPDRETDLQQREAKTALMQRVNQAYEAQDLLTLLELQLEVEQIDKDHIANVSEQRLKHYNKVLSEQLAELKAETEHVEIMFCMEFGVEPGNRALNPRKLGQVLEQTSREWRADLSEQQRELRMFADVAATKRWLKRQRQQRREAEFDFSLF